MDDPIFKRNFGLKTSVHYLKEMVIETGKEIAFQRGWKQAFAKIKPNLSDTREKQFEVYFRRLKNDGDDLYYSRCFAIKYIGKNVGYGVFAKEDIPSYSTLGHYMGMYRLDKEIDPNNDCTFTFHPFKLFSIDAKTCGNWTRFMNHAEKGSINVRAWEFYTKESPFIVFTSGSRGIKKGEQLLYSYGDDYWHEDSFTTLKL